MNWEARSRHQVAIGDVKRCDCDKGCCFLLPSICISYPSWMLLAHGITSKGACIPSDLIDSPSILSHRSLPSSLLWHSYQDKHVFHHRNTSLIFYLALFPHPASLSFLWTIFSSRSQETRRCGEILQKHVLLWCQMSVLDLCSQLWLLFGRCLTGANAAMLRGKKWWGWMPYISRVTFFYHSSAWGFWWSLFFFLGGSFWSKKWCCFPNAEMSPRRIVFCTGNSYGFSHFRVVFSYYHLVHLLPVVIFQFLSAFRRRSQNIHWQFMGPEEILDLPRWAGVVTVEWCDFQITWFVSNCFRTREVSCTSD